MSSKINICHLELKLLPHQCRAMAKQDAICFEADGGLVNGVAMTLPAKSSDFSEQRSSVIKCNFSDTLKRTLKLFRDYLRHLGMVTMAAVVATLACSLKGTDQQIQCK